MSLLKELLRKQVKKESVELEEAGGGSLMHAATSATSSVPPPIATTVLYSALGGEVPKLEEWGYSIF